MNVINCSSIKKMIQSLINGNSFATEIEKKLKIHEKKWEKILDEKNTKIWRKKTKDNIYLYSTYGVFQCSHTSFFNFIKNIEKRKEWDTSVQNIEILDKGENYIVYDWENKRPWPYGNIFHLCRQEYIEKNFYQIITSSVSPSLYDVKKNVIRNDNYFSYTHIEKNNDKECAVYCMFLDDQKLNIPSIIYKNFTSLFIPNYIKNINKTINENISNIEI